MRDAEHAHRHLRDLTAHHADARAALWQTVAGGQQLSNVEAHAAEWRSRAGQARRTLAEIEALPATEAALLIRDRAAQATAKTVAGEAATAASQARAAEASAMRSPTPVHEPGPERRFGPSL